MASKAKTKTASPKPHATAARREMLNDRHAQQAVERFKASAKGFRNVFGGHFPERISDVETLAFHLAQFEAHLPNTVEAIRLARYPGAGKRNPRRMALGLCENLSVLKAHLVKSIAALDRITNGRPKAARKTAKKTKK
jgi:hypothetical protein